MTIGIAQWEPGFEFWSWQAPIVTIPTFVLHQKQASLEGETLILTYLSCSLLITYVNQQLNHKMKTLYKKKNMGAFSASNCLFGITDGCRALNPEVICPTM